MAKKVYVTESNTITLGCPKCGRFKDVDITPLMRREGNVHLSYRFRCSTCDCGHISCEECGEENCSNGQTNLIQIERRRYFRKKVDLPGSLSDNNKKQYPVRVRNLSHNGVELVIRTPHSFVADQELFIQFTLNDTKKTFIEKTIIVRKVEKFNIKAEFEKTDSFDINNKKIGFYLMH